jgi:hypothetical protein
VQRVVEAAVIERARERVLAVEAVDPRLERADGAAERVDRAGQDADGVAAAPAPGWPEATSSAECDSRSTGETTRRQVAKLRPMRRRRAPPTAVSRTSWWPAARAAACSESRKSSSSAAAARSSSATSG